MSRRNVSRDRNERGFQLSMQNLKGVVSLFLAPQDIAWMKELKQQTSWRLEDAYATLTLMENDISHVPDADNSLREGFHVLLGCVQSLHPYINSYENNLTDNSAVLFAIQHAKRIGDEGPRRPSLDVTKDQLEFLRSMHFSWQKIAQLLQVSVSTLQRRCRAFGTHNQLEQFSDISDQDLDTIHRELTVADGNPSGGSLTLNIGRRRFMGVLRNRGIRVQRWRVSVYEGWTLLVLP